MASNTESKNTMVSQYDSLHSNKANTLSLYLNANPDVLNTILQKKEGYLDLLKNACAESSFNVETLNLYTFDFSTMQVGYDTYYSREGLQEISFNDVIIAPYLYDYETSKVRNKFLPFTYNHSVEENPIIEHFDDPLPENDLIMRYHGCVVKQEGSVYTMLLTGSNPRTLYSQMNSLISLQVVLKDVTVGQSGYVFALNNEGIIKSHPNPEYVGKKYSEVGLSADVLKDNYKGWQTFSIDGKKDKMYCVTSKMDETKIRSILKNYNANLSEEVIKEVTRIYSSLNISVAAVSRSEINSNRIFTASIIGGVFFFIATIQIAYILLVKEELLVDGTQISKKIGKHLYINDTVAKRCIPVTAIGIIVLIGLTIYAQCLFSISTQIDNNKVYLNEVTSTLVTNEKQTKSLKEETENLYLNKLDIIKYSARANEDIHGLVVYTDPVTGVESPSDIRREDIDEATRVRNKRYLTTLAESMGVKEIYIFDIDGETVASSTSYQDFDISYDPKDQSYALWEVMRGHVDYLIQDPMIDDAGHYSQYMAKPLVTYNQHVDEKTGEQYLVKEIVGLVEIGIEPNEYAEKLAVSDVSNVLKNMIFGTKGFAFAIDKKTSTVKYFPSKDASISYKGKSYEEVGLPKEALKIDYFGQLTLNGTSCWVSSNEYDDMYIYVAVPSNEVFAHVINITVATGLIAFVTLSIFTLIYVLNPTDESLEAELVQRNKSFATIKDSQGKERKIVTASARWENTSFHWNVLTAGQKLGIIIRICLGLFGILVLIMTSTSVFNNLSIIPFIKSGRYSSGANIFSFTNAIFFGLVVFVIADIIKVVVRLALKNADARIETVGRLITNMIKYAAVIWVIFRSLSMFGVNTSSLITGASVMSIIVGLGSQSLIADILAGLFIVFEGEFRVGDIVTVGDWRGTVLEIGLRTTKIEDIYKNIKILTNSSISGVVNMTKEYSFAVCEIGVEYGESIERVELALAEDLPLVKEKIHSIKDGPFYEGIQTLNNSSVDIKIIALCDECDRIQLERDLNREVKLIFDRHNINVPFPQMVLNPRVPEMTSPNISDEDKKKAEKFVEEEKEKTKYFDI